tara:strand:+ start:6740 stop:8659 length:1920 start_codon:yes stop_codon:yes gene_type:complete
MYCSHHDKKQQEFLAALTSTVHDNFVVSKHSLYDQCNGERLTRAQDFVNARGEISIFSCSQDSIAATLKDLVLDTIKKESHAFKDVARIYNCAVTQSEEAGEINLQDAQEFTNLLHGHLKTGGLASGMAFMTSFDLKSSPITLELFQSKKDGRTTSMMHFDLAGTVMDPIFFLDAREYNAEGFQPDFERIRQHYLSYMSEFFSSYYKISQDEAMTLAQQVYEVEKSVAQIHKSPVDKRAGNCQITDMDSTEPFLRSFAGELIEFAAPGLQPHDCELVYPDNLLHLPSALQDFPAEHVFTYFSWLAMQNFTKFALPQEYRRMHYNFHSDTLRGATRVPPRWIDVITWQRDFMKDNMCRLLKEKGPSNEEKRAHMKQKMQEMIQKACEEITEIDHWPGSSLDSRAKLRKHVQKITVQVGYPDQFDHIHYDLQSRTLSTMMLEVGRKNVYTLIKKIKEQPSFLSWPMNPLLANACYNGTTNSIVMTETMCLPPFFGQPALFIAAHEITHSFDDQGMHLVKDLPIQTTLGFSKLCTVMKQWIMLQNSCGCASNPDLTLGETLADFIGFRIALRHFQDCIQENESREPTDGEIKNFYCSYALMWGAKSSGVLEMIRKIKDPHPTPRDRVYVATAPLPPCLLQQE